MAAKRVSGTRAGRTALERAGRGRNPVMPRRPAARRKPGGKGGQRNGQPPLTVRGVGLLAGGLLLGVGAGVTLERALIGRDRKREDPETGEPFGGIRGAATTLTSHDGTKLHVEELGQGPCLLFAHGF